MTTAIPSSASVWIPDNSAIACFRESPEDFRLRYRLHLQPTHGDEKMRAGSALHAGRNVLYAARQRVPQSFPIQYDAATVEKAVRVARTHRGELPGPRDANQVEAIMRAYAARYATEPFAVVENERYVEARIHDPLCDGVLCKALHEDGSALNALECFDFCGIQDAVVRFPDSSEYVMDTKSTGARLDDKWETTMRLGDQFVGYVAMRRAHGWRCDGFLVDGIHVNDYVPRKGGAPIPGAVPKVDADNDFVRVGPVGVPEWRIERWARDMRYTLAQIAELERTRGLDEPWPMYQNWPYGKVGAYREFYETAPELHASVALQFERRAWNPQDVADERKVSV